MTPSFPRTGVSGHAGAVQRGDGNLHPESPYARNASNVSSDPKPREGTETRNPAPHPQLRHAPEVVRPKTPRGDGNTETQHQPDNLILASSDPKPREGTETHIARHTTATLLLHVLRPKTPRGDGNPHGGTWTSATIGVVGPKTPRGDGNWTQNRTGCGRCSSRQTQNPERGRKLVRHLCLIQVQCPVVRPKTPRGDGNAPWMADALCAQVSSDPKPREGTET
ncbi:Uncharacterised protein [Mycobacterium tuberculosis]|nr:Uncharacterised protein [Mycobacterium tuberculosis]